MKTMFLSCVFTVLFLGIANADGIPFDSASGRVTEPHERITLTEAQQAEYTAQKCLTLTTAQHQKITKRCPTFPTVIEEVLSHRYGDCTCSVGHPYAIMLPGGNAVAIPHSEFSFVTDYGVRPSSSLEAAAPVKKPSLWRRFWSGLFKTESP